MTGTSTSICRIFGVDDHAIVLEGLRLLIAVEPELEWIGQADGVEPALVAIANLKPDIVIIDIRLGNEDGIALAARLAADQPAVRTIIFSGFSGDEEVYRALDAGARGFVLKEFVATEILLAIDHVRRGLRFVSSQVARRLATSGPRINLTAREAVVLRAVGTGMRNKDIATELQISPATVRTHVERLLEKFDCHDRTRLVAIALARGFLRPDQLVPDEHYL